MELTVLEQCSSNRVYQMTAVAFLAHGNGENMYIVSSQIPKDGMLLYQRKRFFWGAHR